MIISWILGLSILIGQLVKIPLAGNPGGATILDVIVIALCLWGFINLKFKLQKPSLFFRAGLFFILVAVVSLIFTQLKLTPIQYLISFFYTIRFTSFLLLGYLIHSNAFPPFKKNISYILTLSGVGLAILGLLQLIFIPDLRFLGQYGWDPHYFRTVSTFLDPNFLGSYLVLTLLLITHTRSVKNRHIRILTLMIVYLALLTTFSRGAYLAFLATFITFSFLKKSLLTGIMTVILFSGLILGFQIYQMTVAQPRGVDRTKSAYSRVDTWKQGFTIFQKQPILGVGFNSYKFALSQYELADEKFLTSHGSSTNDSSLLYVSATTGIFGLISFILFLFALIKSGWREKILPAAILGLIIQSFFANILFYPPIFLWIILMGV